MTFQGNARRWQRTSPPNFSEQIGNDGREDAMPRLKGLDEFEKPEFVGRMARGAAQEARIKDR